jgi:hypothetical protein
MRALNNCDDAPAVGSRGIAFSTGLWDQHSQVAPLGIALVKRAFVAGVTMA